MNKIRIVLVNTTHPGNIGAAARAMKNMGLSRLYLVSPLTFPDAEATARASGADDLLANAVVCNTLEEALSGTTMVVGLSARERHLNWPVLDVRDSAVQAISESVEGEVALIFGRERTGLLNDELDLCHYLVHIPTNPEFSSLNVAAAVQLMSYELRMAQLATDKTVPVEVEPERKLADADDIERMFAHQEKVMIRTGFLDPENPRLLRRRLRRLYNRARLELGEVQILRGFFTAIEKSLDRRP